MIDKWGRSINYLRISITDRCNLRCIYCMPKEGISYREEKEILSIDEIISVAKAAGELGISKIRITGGEPLVRDGIEELIHKIKRLKGIKEVCLTTNGILLEEKMDSLILAGLDRVNISLDTLKENVYGEITRNGKIDKVLRGIESSIKNGIKVKLNIVIIKGYNDTEIMDFVDLVDEKQIDIRFIELMPIGFGKNYTSFSSKEIRDLILENRDLIKCDENNEKEGPAVYYKTKKSIGRIGFISAMTHSFCESCNRVRLTADGVLKQCLLLNNSINIKDTIRNGGNEEEIKEVLRDVIHNKPQSNMLKIGENQSEIRFMNEIGG